MPGLLFLGPQPCLIDPNKQTVQSNTTIVASGTGVSAPYIGFGQKQVSLLINVKGAITGTGTPTLNVNLQELDPGDQTTVLQTATVAITSTGTYKLTLQTSGDTLTVTWTVSGSSPSFAGVYMTLEGKSTPDTQAVSAASLPLPTGAATAANQTTIGTQTTELNDGTNTIGTSGHPVRTDPTGTTTQPVSAASLPLPTGAATAANQTTVGTQTTELNDGTNTIGVAAHPVRTDPTGTTTQPVSAASLPLPAGAATSANQTTIGTQTTELNDGTNTIGTAAHPVRTDPTGTTTQPVSAASLPLPTGAATSANQTTIGTQTTELNDGTNTIGTSAHPVRTDPTGTTNQPVIGTQADDSANSTTKLPVLPVRANAADPLWTEGHEEPQSSDLQGRIRFNSPDTVGTTTALNALNAAATLAASGKQGVGMQLVAGTLVGTIVPEISKDGGTTWVAAFWVDPSTGILSSSSVFGASNGAQARTIVCPAGVSNVRVRVSAFTSGTANCTLRGSMTVDEPAIRIAGTAPGNAVPPTALQVGGTDGANLRAWMTDSLGIGVIGDFSYGAASGRISGATSGIVLGQSIATAVGTLTATAYTEQASAAVRSLSSSSANDTSAGTGAQQVTVKGYDNSMNAVSEVVSLNGVTAVATTNSYRFIESLTVTRAGSGGVNAGTITLFVNNSGGGGTITTIAVGTLVTGVGDNQTFLGVHYVRAGKTCYILGVSTQITGVETVCLVLRSVNPLATGPAESQIGPYFGARQSYAAYPFRSPIAVVGPSRVRIYRLSISGNLITGSFEYVEF